MHGRGEHSWDELKSSSRWQQAVARVNEIDQSPELELDI